MPARPYFYVPDIYNVLRFPPGESFIGQRLKWFTEWQGLNESQENLTGYRKVLCPYHMKRFYGKFYTAPEGLSSWEAVQKK
jgi:hypothetical protein